MKTEHKLSKLYIREDGKPRCFEDCRAETQDKFLEECNAAYLRTMVKSLSEKLYGLAEQLGMYGSIEHR